MKKILLCLSIFIFAYQTISQTQYTFNDIASIGDSSVLYIVDSNAVDYANVTGDQVTWDYSTLTGYPNSSRSVKILNPNNHPSFSNFQGATHAMEIQNFITSFYSETSTEKQEKGFVYQDDELGEMVAKLNINNFKSMEYPFSLNDNYNDDFSGTMNYTVSGFPQSNPASGSGSVSYDGNGELKLQGLNLANTIRIKTKDSISFNTLQGNIKFIRTQYSYYHFQTSKLPVFIYSKIKIAGFTNLSFNLVMSYVEPSTSISNEESNQFDFKLFPNPASDKINIKFYNIYNPIELSIINAIGQKVIQKRVLNPFQKIDISSLTKGIYFVEIQRDNQLRLTKKIIIE